MKNKLINATTLPLLLLMSLVGCGNIEESTGENSNIESVIYSENDSEETTLDSTDEITGTNSEETTSDITDEISGTNSEETTPDVTDEITEDISENEESFENQQSENTDDSISENNQTNSESVPELDI